MFGPNFNPYNELTICCIFIYKEKTFCMTEAIDKQGNRNTWAYIVHFDHLWASFFPGVQNAANTKRYLFPVFFMEFPPFFLSPLSFFPPAAIFYGVHRTASLYKQTIHNSNQGWESGSSRFRWLVCLPDPILFSLDPDPAFIFLIFMLEQNRINNLSLKWWFIKSNFMPTCLIYKYFTFHFELRSDPRKKIWACAGNFWIKSG